MTAIGKRHRVAIAATFTLTAGLAACGATDDGSDPTPPWQDPGTSEQFYDHGAMPELELLLEPDAISSLEAQPREYVRATIVWQGQSFGPVGVRIKGQNSFQPISGKPSLRIKVDEYVEGATLFGLKDLTLNNMASDPSQMHERLAYQVAREAGMVAPRCNHALLTINGQFYGLYANVETVKPRMLKAYFEDNDGALFEASDVDFTLGFVPQYELESGPDDRTLLNGIATSLTMQPADAAVTATSRYLDMSHFQQYWAMASVVGQFDAFPYSEPGDDYYVYADPTSRKAWLIPSGMDETFFAADVSPLRVHSVLATTCMASQSCYQSYVAAVWDIQANNEAFGLEAERARVEAEIAPHIARDTRKPFTPDEITYGQQQLGYFIRGRREILSGYFPPPQ
ncbi:MAG TPA: CotH kinase family protein [Kofleriaceae bacterium]|nr:CotH kinase family protein [Kofleriaceae bacterium]